MNHPALFAVEMDHLVRGVGDVGSRARGDAARTFPGLRSPDL
jgi:hypothetical protein